MRLQQSRLGESLQSLGVEFRSRSIRSYREILVELLLTFEAHVRAGVVDEAFARQTNPIAKVGITFADGDVEIVEFTEATVGDPFSFLIIDGLSVSVQWFAANGNHIDGVFVALLAADTCKRTRDRFESNDRRFHYRNR